MCLQIIHWYTYLMYKAGLALNNNLRMLICHKTQPNQPEQMDSWYESQTASSRVWTWVTDSIPYDDRYYAKRASSIL